ncbi:ATP-binding cassette domain-containing protein, partial [Pseudomonas aeruginosa]|nr:ATP-binding cassette domain-containing protein [Pseudomonas aeruginosa]
HQELNLVPHMTVAENIWLGREPMKYGFVDHGQLTRQTQALLDKLNIRLTADRLVGDLSIAAQQMVEIAKAVSWNADIVIMDEPTSALDLYYQQHLLRLLKRLTAGGQLHVCVVLHDLNLAALWADRILLLHQGHLVAQGTPQEVIQQPVIHRWYGADVRLVQHPDNAVPQVYLAP